MEHRVMPMGTDEAGTHFLWSDGSLVTKGRDGVWRLVGRVPTPTELLEAMHPLRAVPNREASPEVACDD